MLGFGLLIDNLDIHVLLHRFTDDIELPPVYLHLHLFFGEDYASTSDELQLSSVLLLTLFAEEYDDVLEDVLAPQVLLALGNTALGLAQFLI